MQIIEVLSQKRKGLLRDEVSQLTGISNGGGLTGILEELEQCGFVLINDNFLTSSNGKLYQLSDFFSLFYLHFVKDKKGTNSNYWSTLIDNQLHRNWRGFSFEILCQTHINPTCQPKGSMYLLFIKLLLAGFIYRGLLLFSHFRIGLFKFQNS